MRGVTLVIVQVVLSVLVVGVVMPMVLVRVPAAQNVVAGPLLVIAMMAVVFVVLRLVWPGPRQDS